MGASPGTTHTPTIRRAAPLALVAVMLLGAAGCSDDPAPTSTAAATDATNPPSTGTTQPTRAAQDEQTKREVLGSYAEGRDALEDSLQTSDPTLASLAATHVGQNLETIRRNLADLQTKGQIGQPGPHSRLTDRAEVETLLEGKAIVIDCRIDDGTIVEKATGKVIDGSIATRELRTTLIVDGGRWKIAESATSQEWEGVAGCADGER